METATGLGALIVQWRMLHSETQPEGDVREEGQTRQPGRRRLDRSPFEPVEQQQRKMDENTFPYSIKVRKSQKCKLGSCAEHCHVYCGRMFIS